MEEVKAMLKEIPGRIGSASLTERRHVFDQLDKAIKTAELPEPAVRGICRLLASTLYRYNDNKSRALVAAAVRQLAAHHAEAAGRHLPAALADTARACSAAHASKSSAGTHLVAFSWTCTLLELSFAAPLAGQQEFAALAGVQARLLTSVVASEQNKLADKAHKAFSQALRTDEQVEAYLGYLSATELTLADLVLGSHVVRCLAGRKQTDQIARLKKPLLAGVVRVVVGGKSRSPAAPLLYCGHVLRHLTHAEFGGELLPALGRALLRSPELAVSSAAALLDRLQLDLSQYAGELAKPLGTHIHSKDEQTREDTSRALLALVRHCSDAAAVQLLLDRLLGVLHGSEGKLTVLDQKLAVLKAVGNLSQSAVTGSSTQTLVSSAAGGFVRVFESEAHEGTLVVALRQLRRWCACIAGQPPPQLVDWFKKCLGLKSTTSAARLGHLLCMEVTLKGAAAPLLADITEPLTKTVERAVANSSQVPVVAEGVVAALLLLRLTDVDPAVKLDNVFSMLLDEKRTFFNEKFVQAAPDDAVTCLCQLCERLLHTHAERVSRVAGADRAVARALVLVLCRPGAALVRAAAAAATRRLTAALGGAQLAALMLDECRDYLDSVRVQPSSGELEPAEPPCLTSHLVAFCLGAVCEIKDLQQHEADMLALRLLQPAHHPAVVADRPDLWVRIVKWLGVGPVQFVERHQADLIRLFTEEYRPTKAWQAALSTLVSLAGDALVPPVVQFAMSCLREEALMTVSLEEYNIYRTPEGTLYDTSVKDSAKEVQSANIKRDSKLYSYKEQMEERALRLELEAKRRREGRAVPEQLTAKQKEAVAQQLERESKIRSRLVEVDARFSAAASLVDAAAAGAPTSLQQQYTELLPTLVSSLQSPLAAPVTSQLWLRLARLPFDAPQKPLAETVAHVTLRLAEPQCAVDAGWEAEQPAEAAYWRVLRLLHDRCAAAGRLRAPAFVVCFHLLRHVLETATDDEELMLKGLRLIQMHAELRGDGDLSDPSLLPRRALITLVLRVIGATAGRVQQKACAALLELAACASGEEGCAVAGRPELQALLDALRSPVVSVRDAALRSLNVLADVLESLEGSELPHVLAERIFLTKFDDSDEIRSAGDQLWERLSLTEEAWLLAPLLEDAVYPEECVQRAAASGLASLLQDHGAQTATVLQQLLTLYDDKLEMTPPVLDQFGRVVHEAQDVWRPRLGVALALKAIGPFCQDKLIAQIMSFFVPTGLGDRAADVRNGMLSAALTCVEANGKEAATSLLPVFDEFLDSAPATQNFDSVRQSVVILMGSLAKHLNKTDPKIKPIVTKLIQALDTPSEQVQNSVSSCLPALVPAIKEDVPAMVRQMLSRLLESDKFSQRRGAAYGIAGLVKGLGILALKQLEIMNVLINAIQDKKDFKKREGALFAFTMLCNMLGRLFEPYIVHVLPHLLLCYGDSNLYVREATDETARAVMSNLSAHGVKLVLPSLLAALEEDSWRTKAGSVELLGSMAYCAPKQLSSCLPSIVPQLIEVLGDSHQRVQRAGAQALKQIGSVIRNPEIQAIVPTLLSALQDPAGRTSSALTILIDTKFVHVIDAPSLALIMPVVQRAFQDRSTEVRKMAAQIIGNMYSLTDQKDLAPYLPGIIPGLKSSLLDPVPEVRSKSARALGAMVRGIGESSFEDLLPWLMQTLTSEQSSVDRSGAAQGLSEVVGGLGVQKLHKLMPDIIATASRTDIAPHVKDGYIMMFIYMPMVFQSEFTPYIGQIIPSILKALADETEFVRETALKAGQRIVNVYADTAVQLLLPELELGLFDDNWRIRFSSIQLLGDLLYRISGVSGKMSTETAGDDDNFGTEHSQQSIIHILGVERRNRVLSGLYMGRSDVALMVRQISLHVWKIVVPNTPRTLREILPTLFTLLLGHLASTSHDKRQVAARTLGDLVRKLGERVLPEIIPILERGLQSDEPDQRQGVCIGLSEIMASTSRDMVLAFVDSLVPTVRRALSDPLPEVRAAAAQTFDSLHNTVGTRALDEILPPLMEQLSHPGGQAEYVLDGLRQVMAIKSRVVLPYMVPQLTAPPVNTKALSILASVAGDALTRHLGRILPALMSAMGAAEAGEPAAEQAGYCESVILSVLEPGGVRTVVDELLEATRAGSLPRRRAAVALLASFCGQTRADYEQHVPQLLRGLTHLFIDEDERLLQSAWEGLSAVIKRLELDDEHSYYIPDVRQAVRFAASDLKGKQLMPGFCLPKGITPMLPIFREAVLNGAPELKESAAAGLAEMIRLTSPAALRTSVVHITGPLIRILGDRFAWNVKVAVLECLALLLEKVGVMLKPFLPQLQTTFLKALVDPHKQVRLRAATALGRLIPIHTRVDPLFTELHSGIRSAEDTGVRDTTLQALRNLVGPAGDKMGDAVRKPMLTTLLDLLGHTEESTRLAAAGCLAALCRWLPPDELHVAYRDTILDDDSMLDWTVRHGRSAALYVALKCAPEQVLTDDWTKRTIRVIVGYVQADRPPLVMNGLRAAGYLLRHQLSSAQGAAGSPLLAPLVRSINNNSNEVKQLSAQVVELLASGHPEPLPADVARLVIPMLVNGTKEKNTVVRACAESALVAVLRLRHGQSTQEEMLAMLDAGARDSLQEVISKVLRKDAALSGQQVLDLDETVLS
ncbi:eIF-2-alpha kinase activator GCN1-like [Pollicipes pollicipes]|uniref:eIF-2-alpha kinase activator GCN1-like n=1 Tax=Pollicipes pollicipes TaxID=41117 RepID=UPI00188554CB|nr:eIF-2-alpha kinase activator GCN1-like [Pollicipes pollicipes]XP_037092853.1 eIF-2-alpha kinase activator GCN1-like [Pollicipes pollicipes]XP_037092854.1 eIF-2-alpha kinase activator GCN1-like [Pollicipes pollicipes]XP_037092855.1 eIF-2-alpha kinase activator GCN1-like [Pollicipes pollicipes]